MRIRTTGQARRLRRRIWGNRAEEARKAFGLASDRWMAAVFGWDRTGTGIDLIRAYSEAMDKALRQHRHALKERDRK